MHVAVARMTSIPPIGGCNPPISRKVENPWINNNFHARMSYHINLIITDGSYEKHNIMAVGALCDSLRPMGDGCDYQA